MYADINTPGYRNPLLRPVMSGNVAIVSGEGSDYDVPYTAREQQSIRHQLWAVLSRKIPWYVCGR